MPTRHNKYGGSTMSRTLHCPAWAYLAAKLPKAPAGEAAHEGTLIHEALEAKTLDQPINLPEDLRPRFEACWEAVAPMIESADEIEVEAFVELIPDLAGGSADLILRQSDRVQVIDYKTGHVSVRAENNAQLLFMALCAAVDPKTASLFDGIDTIELIIIQPNDDGDIIDCWEAPISVLDEFEEQVYKAIDLAETDDAEPVSGKHCQYCPAAAICPIKTGAAEMATRLAPDIAADVSQALKLIPELESFIKAVQKLAFDSLNNGVPIEGYKLVEKRARRVWADETEVMDRMRKKRKIKLEEACEYKLKSPAQLEKTFKQLGLDPKELGDYIVSVSSGLTLAPESDKRPDARAASAAIANIAKRIN